MIYEEPTLTFITFLLAIVGYTGLTAVVILSLRNKIPVVLWRITTLIILVHIILVWAHRYDWQILLATRNGYFGFIIFHSALLLILISNFVKQNISEILIRLSFLIVTAGAIGATFRYEVVEIYRIPVIILAAAGCVGLLWWFIRYMTSSK